MGLDVDDLRGPYQSKSFCDSMKSLSPSSARAHQCQLLRHFHALQKQFKTLQKPLQPVPTDHSCVPGSTKRELSNGLTQLCYKYGFTLANAGMEQALLSLGRGPCSETPCSPGSNLSSDLILLVTSAKETHSGRKQSTEQWMESRETSREGKGEKMPRLWRDILTPTTRSPRLDPRFQGCCWLLHSLLLHSHLRCHGSSSTISSLTQKLARLTGGTSRESLLPLHTLCLLAALMRPDERRALTRRAQQAQPLPAYCKRNMARS